MDHIITKKQKLSFVFYIILAAIIFIFDILILRRIAVWVLYVFPVAGISCNGNKKNILIITSLSTFFIFIGYFLSPADVNPGYLALPARILGILALWGLTFLLINKKSVENNLQESEERQRIVLEAAKLGTWDLDLVTDTAVRSFRHDQIWGYSEPQKKWGFEIAMKNVAAEDRQLIIEAYERGIKTGLLFHENRVIWPDSSTHWIRAYGRFRYNDEGKPVRVMGIVEDITERKKVEQDLRDSEEKFATAFRSNPNALVLSRLDDGTILEMNETFLKLFGYSKEEVIGNSSIALHMFANPEDRAKAIELVQKYGKIRDFEVSVKSRSGDERTVLLSSELMPVGGVNSILTILQDITELRQERLKWQGIVEGIADEVWVCDANGRMDLIKLGETSPFGNKKNKNKTLEEVLEDVEILNPDWQPRPGEDAPLLRSLKGEIVRGEEILRNKATGIDIHRQFTSAPMRDNNGKIIGAVAIVRDITEQKENEQQLKEALRKLNDSEAKLLDAQRLAHVGSFTVNYWKNDYVEWSEEMFRIYGRPIEMGNPTVSEAFQMIHPEDVERVRTIIEGAKTGNQRIEVEYRILLPDDSIKYLKTIINPVIDTSGKLNMVFGTSLDITESKLTEEALRESEARLLEAEQLAHVGSFSYDIPSGLVEWTPETYKIFELDSEKKAHSIEVLQSYFHPDDRAWVLQKIKYGMEHNEIINFECRLLLHNGKAKHISYVGRPVYDSKGKPVKRIGAISDITERKLAQMKLEEIIKKLRESEFKLLDAQKLAHMGNYTLDISNNNKIEWSDQLYEIWELDKSKPIPPFEKIFNLIHPEDKDKARKALTEEIKEKNIIETEFRILFPDNRVKYVHLITRGFFDQSGNLIRREGVEIDITDRKVQQQELENALTELKKSEEKLLDTQKLAHVGSFSYNLQAGTSEWSDETYKIYEWDLHKDPPSLETIHSLIHPKDLDNVNEAINYGMENNSIINVEHRLLLHSNKIKYVNYIARPVYDNKGRPLMRIGAVMDITERKNQQQRLEEALEELQRSNRDLEQFAYITSHDLQEPIRMIKSYTDLLAGRYVSNLDQNAKEFFGFISESSSRMQQLVSDLLKYSRISTQAKPFENIDCNEILEEVLKDLKFVILENEAVVEYEKLPVIKGDKTQIRQVFQNLIQNAIKFKNLHNPLIEIKSRRKRDFWFFSVTDNGIGIDKQYLERIFVIFQRLHTKDEYPGTGIGLAIVKKIIERHGGEIFVESEPGKGSTFYFTVPVRV